MHSYRHGTKVRVEGGTTHPAQLELMVSLFGSYAKPIFEATKTPQGAYGIRATFDLHSSFRFLLKKPGRISASILNDDALFQSALSGFSDAEGFAGLRRNRDKVYASYSLSNRKFSIMNDFLYGLNSRKHNCHLYALNYQGKIQWQINANGRFALELFQYIEFRHREKIEGVRLAQISHQRPWKVAGPVYLAQQRAIKAEVTNLSTIASSRINSTFERRQIKKEIMRSKIESSFELFARGMKPAEVAKALSFSIRTAYRRKNAFMKSSVEQ